MLLSLTITDRHPHQMLDRMMTGRGNRGTFVFRKPVFTQRLVLKNLKDLRFKERRA